MMAPPITATSSHSLMPPRIEPRNTPAQFVQNVSEP